MLPPGLLHKARTWLFPPGLQGDMVPSSSSQDRKEHNLLNAYHLLCAVLGSVWTSSQIILTQPCEVNTIASPQVIDEETEAQRVRISSKCPQLPGGLTRPAPEPFLLSAVLSWPLRWRNRWFCWNPGSEKMHSAWACGQAADFGLVSLLKGMSQFLKRNRFPSMHTPSWFCFSGEGQNAEQELRASPEARTGEMI